MRNNKAVDLDNLTMAAGAAPILCRIQNRLPVTARFTLRAD